MRKNKFMRAASGLLVAVLLTTCVISGTFAKYTTTSTGADSARVATWGFDDKASIKLDNLFDKAYSNTDGNETVKSVDADVIAPGTNGFATFQFKYSGAKATPEVGYTFNVSTDGSSIKDAIKKNSNIQWKLDDENWGTWDQMIADIEALDGNKAADTDKKTPADYYAPNSLPTAFNEKNQTHTVSWQWKFDENNNDVTDTEMGNAADLADVTLKITITATQVD